MFPLISLLLPLITSVVGKVIPDTAKAAEINAELQKALIERQTDLDKAVAEAAKAQAEINLEEAKSGSLFVAGWRPYIGWVCGGGFTYGFIAQPIVSWLSSLFGGPALPLLDTATLLALTFGMLGLGGLRTYEKAQGVPDTKIIAKKK